MKILVVVPTYNEAENIRDLLKAVLEKAPKVEVLVVDDHSPDGTADIVREVQQTEPRVHLLERPGKQGLGTAYVAGFKYALAHGYDAVMEMDADFSHDPADIPRFLEALKEADVVLGSRYLNGVSVVNWPLRRLMLSYTANRYAALVTGVPLRDLTGGFKAIRREVLEAVGLDNLESDGYAFQIELTVRAWYLGFKIVEIPIVFWERRKGASKMSKRIIWEAAWRVWKFRIEGLRLQRNRRTRSAPVNGG